MAETHVGNVNALVVPGAMACFATSAGNATIPAADAVGFGMMGRAHAQRRHGKAWMATPSKDGLCILAGSGWADTFQHISTLPQYQGVGGDLLIC